MLLIRCVLLISLYFGIIIDTIHVTYRHTLLTILLNFLPFKCNYYTTSKCTKMPHCIIQEINAFVFLESHSIDTMHLHIGVQKPVYIYLCA